ncbi:MAG: SET domain-containing protein [Chloroflexota bacterium]|nr:SET domain-containing protein [Chloroflexota bacterium]
MTPADEKRLEIFSTVLLLGAGLLGVLISILDLIGADYATEPWKWIKGAVPLILLAVGILAMLLGLARVWSKYKRRLPHDRVYVRLAPSSIHGVGLFAIARIKKGTRIFYDDSKVVWVEKRSIDELALPEEIVKLYTDFCIPKDGYYGCPKNFNLITPSWYLNHSDNPNAYRVGDEYSFFALRDIEKGEELTEDFRVFGINTFSNTTV